MKRVVYLFVSVCLSTIIVGCHNKTNEVQQAAIDVELSELQETKEAMVKPSMPKDTPDNFGRWKFGYFKDEFGDEIKEAPYIMMDINGVKGSKEGKISIYFSNEGFRIFIDDSFYRGAVGDNWGPEVLVKKDGEVYKINIEKHKGGSYITDDEEIRNFASLLEEGNFRLSVYDYIANISTETSHFIRAAQKLSEMVDEYNQPEITREDPPEDVDE